MTTADLLTRRLRALEELRATAEVALLDAQDAVQVAERARKESALRMAREDLAAAEAQVETLARARELFEAEAAGTPFGGARGAQDGRGHVPGADVPAEPGRASTAAGGA